jgi:two-component system, NarL family, response regulator DegU
MGRIRVLIVDDNEAFRESLTNYLAREESFDVVASLSNAEEALSLLLNDDPPADLVLIDLALPNMNGLDAARTIKGRTVSPKVIVMSLHDELGYRDAAMAAKADGFLNKQLLGTNMMPLVEQLFSDKYQPA